MAIFTWHNGEIPEGVQITQVYGLIFSREGHLLLKAQPQINNYGLAGGHPEPFDRGIEETLRRELIEEVNMTITKPLLVGYQLVDEEDGTPPFAQVRMTALINTIGVNRPDTDNGKFYERLLTAPMKAAELLNWGDVGYAQIKAAIDIAAESYGIADFNPNDKYI